MKKIFLVVVFVPSFLWGTFDPIINVEIEFSQNARWGVFVPAQMQNYQSFTYPSNMYSVSQTDYTFLKNAILSGLVTTGNCAGFQNFFKSNLENAIDQYPYNPSDLGLVNNMQNAVSGMSGSSCFDNTSMNNVISQIQYIGYPAYQQDASTSRTLFSASSNCQIFYYNAPLFVAQVESLSVPFFQMSPFIHVQGRESSESEFLDLEQNSIANSTLMWPFNTGFPADFSASTDGTWKSTATVDKMSSTAQQNLQGSARAQDASYSDSLPQAQANKIVSFAAMSPFVTAGTLNNFVNSLLGGNTALWEESGSFSTTAQNQFVIYLDLTQIDNSTQKIPFGTNSTW